MIVYPAIDLHRGRCVRLVQGSLDAETVVSEDPTATARKWAEMGAEWLHVVNLDGAFGDESEATGNIDALRDILKVVEIPIQLGGGLRVLADIESSLAMGVSRVIVGTAALKSPDMVQEAVARYGPERIALAIDVRDGQVATHGWQQLSSVIAVELALQMKEL